MVQYSKIIREGDTQNARKGVITASLFSLVLSLFGIAILLILPNSILTLIFTDECANVKQITLLMSPGILSIAFSNVYVHYFTALGKMKIVVFKSAIGAVLTAILLVILLPLWKINGACITSSIVHFVCSAIIVVYFFMIKNKEKMI
jgi:O-antigen/teichoic acid export membrane protein